ncbi:MAG TPA: AAA family ATPase [Candidatus Dormibacteraeota bacterium]|nr:AAA family ATPase [Candidatus Dormibacteraeota bacterium]
MAGPQWVEGNRLAGYVALALAESLHDRVRMRRLLQQLSESAPVDAVQIPDLSEATRDVTTAIDRMRERSPGTRRAELLRLVAIEGIERSEAAQKLFLSERQFYRVRQEAAEELADELTTLWRSRRASSRRPAGPATISGERPPLLRSFVGRALELEEAAQLLHTHGILLLGGPPGIGKTALAAQIATLEGRRFTAVWHRFRSGLSDSPAAVLLALADALAATGDDRLQQHLTRATTQPLWLPGAIDLAKRGIGEQPWLLCFDDTDVIVDNAPVCGLLHLLFEECPAVRILLVGRSELWRIPNTQRLVLAGLDKNAVVQLLGELGVAGLPDEQVTALLEMTGGSPQMIRFAANMLVRAARPDQAIAALQDEPDVHSFLLVNVFEQLRDDERQILKGASLLRAGVTAAFLARAFRDLSDSVPDAMARLARQFLLASTDSGLRLHATLRQFCRRQLSDELAATLHRNLAHAYSAAGDTVEACHHWLEAGDVRDAREALLASGWRGLSLDRRHALADIGSRVLDAAASRPDDSLLLMHGELLRALGREMEVRDLLRRHVASIREPALLVSLAELERQSGDIEAARAVLAQIVSGRVARGQQWEIWWETARLERAAEKPDAAVRAARRAVALAGDDAGEDARLGALATELLPTASRLAASVATGMDTDLIEPLLMLDPARDGGLLSLVTLAAVSRGLDIGPDLVKKLRAAAVSNAVLEADVWCADAVHAAALGDYRTAAHAMWRSAERADVLGHGADAAIAALHAAIYRMSSGDQGAAQANIDWARDRHQGPSVSALTQFVEAVRWLRGRAGEPPDLTAPDDVAAVASAAALIEAVRTEQQGPLQRAVELSRKAALDHRMVLLDLIIAIGPDAALTEERRRLRLPQQISAPEPA